VKATQGVLPAVVVGGGPAGLMAAEALAAAGVAVDLYDAMPSVGRKFLLAGKGGLNLTHSEPLLPFVGRYGAAGERVAMWLDAFGPQALREWANGLGVETFVGTSGRVFPVEMKAAPLLRAWLHRLRAAGVKLHMRRRWIGWDARGVLRFEAASGPLEMPADALVLATGGASWPKLGSDGAWVPLLALAETTWVLSSVYECAPAAVATAVEMLLNHEHLALQDADAVAQAVDQFRRKRSLEFSDCLMLAVSRKTGHVPLGTFDRARGRLEGAQRV